MSHLQAHTHKHRERVSWCTVLTPGHPPYTVADLSVLKGKTACALNSSHYNLHNMHIRTHLPTIVVHQFMSTLSAHTYTSTD